MPVKSKLSLKKKMRILQREVKEDTRSWRAVLCSWIGIVSIVKMARLTEVINRFNAIPINLPMIFATRKSNPKIHLEKLKPVHRQSHPQQTEHC